MIENQVWHTLSCQGVKMGMQIYFTHTFNKILITNLILEAFKIWSIVTVFLLRLYLRSLTFSLFQCWTTTVIWDWHTFCQLYYQMIYKLSHIYLCLMLLNASSKQCICCLAHPSWAKMLCYLESSCGIFSHFTYLELKMKALTCIQYINLARNK